MCTALRPIRLPERNANQCIRAQGERILPAVKLPDGNPSGKGHPRAMANFAILVAARLPGKGSVAHNLICKGSSFDFVFSSQGNPARSDVVAGGRREKAKASLKKL
jgi:hypothetical protein